MKSEPQIRAKLHQMIDKFELSSGSSALADALTIQTLEWVLDVKDKYIDLRHPMELLKTNELHDS